MSTKIALIAPEDMSKLTAWTLKTFAAAQALAVYGDVSLYGYNLPESNESSGFRGIDLSATRPFGHSIGRSIPVYIRLVYQILKGRYGYIYMPTVLNIFFPALFVAARIAGSRIIYNMHDSIALMVRDMPDELNRRASNALVVKIVRSGSGLVERLILRLSHHVITVSPTLVRYANRLSGKSQDRLSLVYNYVKSSEDLDFQPCAEFMVLRNTKSCLLLLLGHLQPDIRGGELVFAAMSNLDPADYHLVVLGEIEDREYWEALIHTHSIRDRVTFIEPVSKERMLRYLTMVDAEVVGPHPSFALPNKLFDAYSVALPVLVPNTMTDALETLGPCAINYEPTPENLAEVVARWHEIGKPLSPRGDHFLPTFQDGLTDVFSGIFGVEPPSAA